MMTTSNDEPTAPSAKTGRTERVRRALVNAIAYMIPLVMSAPQLYAGIMTAPFLVYLVLMFSSQEGVPYLFSGGNMLENIVVYHNPPIITLRVKVMELPKENREALYEKLLTLNATELLQGAYGLEEGFIVLLDTLQSENLDANELQASIDSLSLALSSHYGTLSAFKEGGQNAGKA